MQKHTSGRRSGDRCRRRPPARVVPPLFAAALAFAVAVDVAAAPPPPAIACADIPVSISAAAADADSGCRGAALAVAFLAERGFSVRTPIVVEVVGRIDILPDASVLGIYDPAADVVKVLARSAFSSGTTGDTVLGLPVDGDLYASVFTHEVAHAVIYQNIGDRPLSFAAHEYLAYAVQLATLPPAHRAGVLARFPSHGFDELAEVSELMLGFDPDRFAVKAYLHFRELDDQDAVLRRLLADFPTAAREWY